MRATLQHPEPGAALTPAPAAMSNEHDVTDEFLTTAEVAELLGVSVSTVQRRIANDDLTAEYTKGKYLVPRSALQAEEPAEVPTVADVVTARFEALPLLLDAEQAAELLGMSPGSVRDACRKRRLPSCKMGRRTFIPLPALADFLNGGAS